MFLVGKSGALAIGPDPGEWWAGHDTMVEAVTVQVRGMGTRKVEPGDLSTLVEGTVSWAAERRAMQLASGKELPIRETMVFHQEDGEWKLVQFHASVAVPNAELTGYDPEGQVRPN
jgi:hypothetical protein